MVLKVALTGGIGSGKSTVAKLFAELGIEIIDADLIAHEITKPNNPAYQLIVAHFGQEIVTEEHQINRKQLRQIIFNDPQQKIWLEETLHPLILQNIRTRLSKIHTPYCIIVIPLLAETALKIDFIDRICVVDAPENLRKQWAANRDQVSAEQIAAIISNQASSTARLAMADDIIINDQDQETLKIKVKKLHQQYLQMTAV